MHRKLYVSEVCIKYQHEVYHGEVYLIQMDLTGKLFSPRKNQSSIPGRQGWSLRNISTLWERREM